MLREGWLVGLLGLLGCARVEPERWAITLPEDAAFELADVTSEPAHALRALRRDGRTLHVEATGPRVLHVPGMCSLAMSDSASRTLVAKPLFELVGSLAQIGYGVPAELRALPGCAEAEHATLRWQQVGGAPLGRFEVEERGQRVRVQTGERTAYLPDPLPHGVVAVSPRTQGRAELELVVHTGETVHMRRRVTVTATARATGLSSVAVSQRILLGGEGWHVTRPARGGRAQVERQDGVASFTPDTFGRFTLADGDGRELEIQALRHDLTPLDCARSECHAAISRAALTSPMSHALSAPFAHGREGSDARCMLDCHVVGEPGLSDGGFRDVARALAWPTTQLSFDALPHALQRLAGVRCTSCHGPGAVPAHAGRARVLRADVCATCHDAPPRYTHVDEWQRSRMARADEATGVREDASCARCHTTGGFLNHVSARARADLSRDEAGVRVGIACAACHAPHGEHVGRALVRALPGRTRDASGLCTGCHAPALEERTPRASAAPLWLGRVRLPGDTEDMARSAPHAQLVGGCVGCHGQQIEAEPGRTHTDHGFAVDLRVCTSCHGDAYDAAAIARGREALRARAASALAKLEKSCGTTPDDTPHATNARACADLAHERARYAALLVAEDGAAYVHNAPFARALLDAAELRPAR